MKENERVDMAGRLATAGPASAITNRPLVFPDSVALRDGRAGAALLNLFAMGGGVFLIRDDGELLEMAETAYDSEAVRQELLARYPNLLTSDAGNDGPPRRWVLVSREVSLTSVGGTSGAWSVDHLLLDQDGIPTLVEVKRSTNSEIRRGVVGQMLDYAANASSTGQSSVCGRPSRQTRKRRASTQRKASLR